MAYPKTISVHSTSNFESHRKTLRTVATYTSRQYAEFKRNQFSTMNLQGEFMIDKQDGMDSNDGRSPTVNLNVSGRTTRSQTQLQASMANQVDITDSNSAFVAFSHATAANFKFQRGPAIPSTNANYTVSPSPSGNYPYATTNASASPTPSQSVPYPQKGRPKRGNYD